MPRNDRELGRLNEMESCAGTAIGDSGGNAGRLLDIGAEIWRSRFHMLLTTCSRLWYLTITRGYTQAGGQIPHSGWTTAVSNSMRGAGSM